MKKILYAIFMITFFMLSGCTNEISSSDVTSTQGKTDKLPNEGYLGNATTATTFAYPLGISLEKVMILSNGTLNGQEAITIALKLLVGNYGNSSETLSSCNSVLLLNGVQYDLYALDCMYAKVYPDGMEALPVTFIFSEAYVGGICWDDVPEKFTFLFETDYGVVKYYLNKSDFKQEE